MTALPTRILVIDDERFVRETIKKSLARHHEYEVFMADDGDKGITLCQEVKPHIVFLDLNMPGSSGLDYIDKYDLLPEKAPVVIFSAEDYELLTSAKRLAEKKRIPILGVVQKPITYTQLLRYIGYAAHSKRLIERKPQRLLNQQELETAIANDWLKPYFQPQVNVDNGEVAGLEVLARIEHPQYGLIAPASFLPLAEACGLMAKITESITDQALSVFKEVESHSDTMTISINITADVMESYHFPDYLKQLTNSHNVETRRVMVELTETVSPVEPENLLLNMISLRFYRFQLSVDDFGTGFASLGQLNELPFQELKIDKSFVDTFLDNANARLILESSIKLAIDLGLDVVAEGVETRQQAECLKKLGVHRFQGYLFYRPMPADKLKRLLLGSD